MNCKPGDLAIIVQSKAGNEGKVVRIVKFVGQIHGWAGNDRWEIDQEIPSWPDGSSNTAQDKNLRPLRDDEGDDETLQWAPVPVKENYHA